MRRNLFHDLKLFQNSSIYSIDFSFILYLIFWLGPRTRYIYYMKIITLSIVIKTLFIRFYHKKVLHCWTSCNCNIILRYLEYAYQNQFTWYELLILHVSWFCWKCVKFHRTFLSCYVIDCMISVYLCIHYDILLNFLKSTDRIFFPINYFNVQFYEYLLTKEKFWICKYYASCRSQNISLLQLDIDIIFLSKNLFAIKVRIANEAKK